MASLDGAPTAAQILTYTDSLAAILKYNYSALGTLASGDTSSMSYYADLARTKILGNGGSYYGLGSPTWQGNITGAINSLASSCRYDTFLSGKFSTLVSQLDSLVSSNLPKGWKFTSTSTQAHAIDFHLTRLNAISAATPATPTATPVLTATNNPLGAMPNVVYGNAPRFVFTLVGANDYNESLPSAEATQVALTGSNNSYTAAISGTVPSGIFKIRCYRGYFSGSTGFYYWDQDVPCSAGGSFPTITLLQNDPGLLSYITPPSWMSALVSPEFAAEFALAYGSGASGISNSGSSTPGITLATNGQLSPYNVYINPSNSFLGVGNPSSSGVFSTSTITAANTQTNVAGVLQTVNNSSANVQGFAGSAGGLRARVTTAFTSGVCTVTISYTYLDATHGQTPQTGTSTSSAFATGSLGDVVNFSITSGRLITSASVTAVSGAATAGVFVLESLPARTI